MLKPTPRVNRCGSEGVSELTVRTLFDSEEKPLLRYACALIGRRALAEEIVQEVFLQLHANWDGIDSPKAWLFRSVRNRAYNHIRDHQREFLAGESPEPERADGDVETPEANFVRLEATGALRKIIEELNETDRQLVTLKYFEGLTYREIGEKTGLTVGNVGYRLHHLLKDLAKKLRPFGIDIDP